MPCGWYSFAHFIDDVTESYKSEMYLFAHSCSDRMCRTAVCASSSSQRGYLRVVDPTQKVPAAVLKTSRHCGVLAQGFATILSRYCENTSACVYVLGGEQKVLEACSHNW